MNSTLNFNKDKILSTLNNFFQDAQKFAGDSFESAKRFGGESVHFVSEKLYDLSEGAQKFAGDSFESAKRFGGESVHFVSEKFNGFSKGVSESFEEFQKIMLKNFEEFQKFDRKKQIIIGLIAFMGFASIVGLIVGGVYLVKKNRAEKAKQEEADREAKEKARLAQEQEAARLAFIENEGFEKGLSDEEINELFLKKAKQEEEARLLKSCLNEFPVDEEEAARLAQEEKKAKEEEEEADKTQVPAVTTVSKSNFSNQNQRINPKEFIESLLKSLTNENKEIFFNSLKEYNFFLKDQNNISDQEALQIINIIQEEGVRKIILNLRKESKFSQLNLEKNGLSRLLNSIYQIYSNQENNQLSGGNEEILALTAALTSETPIHLKKFNTNLQNVDDSDLKKHPHLDLSYKSKKNEKGDEFPTILLDALIDSKLTINKSKIKKFQEFLLEEKKKVIEAKNKAQRTQKITELNGKLSEICNSVLESLTKRIENKFTKDTNSKDNTGVKFESSQLSDLGEKIREIKNNEKYKDIIFYLNSSECLKEKEEQKFKQIEEILELLKETLQSISDIYKKSNTKWNNKSDNEKNEEEKNILINFKAQLDKINAKYNKDERKTDLKFQFNEKVNNFLSPSTFLSRILNFGKLALTQVSNAFNEFGGPDK